MKILLVGASSSLALALKPVLEEFAEVVTAGRTGCDVYLDLIEPIEAISIASGFDTVINCAAQFGGKLPEDIINAENVNVVGTLKLCRACTNAAVGQLVNISSSLAGLDPASSFYNEYTLSKRHADEVAQLYSSRFGLPLLIIRPSQIYGADESFRKHQSSLYAIMDKAQQNQDIVIFGSNDALRNFIYVEDVATVIALAVKQKLIGNFACVYSENVRLSQIVGAAISAFDSCSNISFDKDLPDIQDNGFPVDDELYKAIGFFPQISILAGLQKEAVRRGANL